MKYLLLAVFALAITSCEKEAEKNLVQVDLSFTGETQISSAKVYNGHELVIDLGVVPIGQSERFSLDEGGEYNFVLVTENAKPDESQRVTVYTSFSGLFRKHTMSPYRDGNTLTIDDNISTVRY